MQERVLRRRIPLLYAGERAGRGHGAVPRLLPRRKLPLQRQEGLYRPLEGKGEYPAYLACNLFTNEPSMYVAGDKYPKVTQEGRDGDEEDGYIANITDTTVAGYKYFECKGVTRFAITTRGYASGTFAVRTAWDGEILGSIQIRYTNIWTRYEAEVNIPDGVHAIYLTYSGQGEAQLKSFELI